MIFTGKKKEYISQLVNENNVIGALAIDQRGALKKMMGKFQEDEVAESKISEFKKVVSSELTKYASSILLDPEYGLDGAKVRDKDSGLLLAYEKTGYDAKVKGRLPDLLSLWSVKRLKEQGADACKFLLYYDVDEDIKINEQKKVFIERIGSECLAEDIPHKVIDMMKEFSNPRYGVDVLKVEVPVNMDYVEGYGNGEFVHTKEEAMKFFKEQSEATNLPFIFLSAGVSARMFQETLKFAKLSGSKFNGVLCGRATWANGVDEFILKGEESAREWMKTQGRKNIQELNDVLNKTATPIILE